MKKLINLLPSIFVSFLRLIYHSVILCFRFPYWLKQDLRYSNDVVTKESLLSSLLIKSHVLEKGLTMPNRKLGFGLERVRDLINICSICINEYGANYEEIQSSLADLWEYLKIHEEENFVLPLDIMEGIRNLLEFSNPANKSFSLEVKREDYFTPNANFEQLAHQRHSIRNYSEDEVDLNVLKKAISLSQTAPSACNRQSVRIRIITHKKMIGEVLEMQNGNRGFGHLVNKLLLISIDSNAWSYDDRNSAYIDAGIYTMNLLYSLHYYRLCACSLNAHLVPTQVEKLKDLLSMKKSETPIVFISVGNAPSQFLVARSHRLSPDRITTLI